MYCRSCNIAAILQENENENENGLDVYVGVYFTISSRILQSPINLSYTWLGFLHFSNRRNHGFHGRPTHYLRAQKLAFIRCYQVFLSHMDFNDC